MATMCIPINGTLSSTNLWYKPNIGELWHHLKETFTNDYFDESPEYFKWELALATNDSRWYGGELLFQYCDRQHRERGITRFRLIGHSHGASVANICTHRMAENNECAESDEDEVSWRICQLVMLAPYVGRRFPADHQPNLDYVDEMKFFNFHAEHDPIVPRFNQNYRAFPLLRERETEVVFEGKFGHWKPTRKRIWDRYHLAEILLNG